MNGIMPDGPPGGPKQRPRVGGVSTTAQSTSPNSQRYQLPCTMTALPPDNCGMRIVELSWVKMQIRIPYSLKFLCRCHCGRQFHARRRLKTAQQKLRLQQTPQEWGNDEATEK